jgi:glycosyltransferase involved in cell wall biosynthesis
MNSLLLLATHAVQYQTPLFRCLHEQFDVDLHVVFLQEPAIEQPYWDRDFGRYVQWDIPLTQGYSWSVLPAGSLVQRLLAFLRVHRDHGGPPIMLTGWGTHLHWLIWTVLGRIPVLQGAETNKLSYALRSRPLWRHLWLCFLIRRTAALLCIGQRNREFYEWMGAPVSHMFSYPYAVDNERFFHTYQQYRDDRQARLQDLGLDPALPVLLFCGKLIHKKRPDLLLQAVSVAGLGPHVNVLLVGSGELRPNLEAQAAGLGLKRVSFLGFLNQSKMPLAYVLGDVLCLLSDTPSETWGLVVNEALACGRPVLVSEGCGCVPDLVDGKGTGWTVPPGDLASTARVLGQAMDQVALWPAMGERGRGVVALYSLTAMARGVVTALRSL